MRTKPLRHPDVSSQSVMTRRAWWLVVIGFLIPGSAQVLAGNRKLGRIGLGATLTLWFLLLVTLGLAIFARPLLYRVFTNSIFLTVLQILIVAYAVLWVILAIDTLRLVKFVRVRANARIGVAALSAILMVGSASGALYAANLIGVTNSTITDIFVDAPVVEPDDGYYNILLLGADSGAGRDSMRFDSISVVSINAETGAVTITGIPRDMPHVPFAPGPMQDLYPNGHEGYADDECGWSSAINQLTTEVNLCRDGNALYPDAIKNNSEPGIEATKDAAEGVLGITIPYYVFIDMDHFAALIDALGGVDINVLERLPKGGGPSPDWPEQPAEEWAIGWIEAGQQHMDGDTAQWYARSRYTTSDWDRMRRQRELQAAVLAQFTPQTVLMHFQDVAKAGADMVDTDLPQSLLPHLMELAEKARTQEMKTIELVPPLVDPEEPDFNAIHQVIQDALHPAPPTPAGEG